MSIIRDLFDHFILPRIYARLGLEYTATSDSELTRHRGCIHTKDNRRTILPCPHTRVGLEYTPSHESELLRHCGYIQNSLRSSLPCSCARLGLQGSQVRIAEGTRAYSFAHGSNQASLAFVRSSGFQSSIASQEDWRGDTSNLSRWPESFQMRFP